MFSGIIESLGRVEEVTSSGNNLSFRLNSSITSELKVDQSISHNGVCLTVESIVGDTYKVTAIEETLKKTNLGSLKIGSLINLERCISLGSRLDGHIVQGHVDATGTCISKESRDGSWLYSFEYPEAHRAMLVEKGSICVNGVSLTAFNCFGNTFSVAIIPYTFNHTTVQSLEAGDIVNLEFDILGKYFLRWMETYKPA